MNNFRKLTSFILVTSATIATLIGCTPTVKVEAPDKAIVVNMNLNIEHTVKVQIQRDLEDTFKKNPDLF